MRLFKVILLALILISHGAISYADSIIISFTDGSTQTVPLSGSITTIATVQYQASGTSTPAASDARPVATPPLPESNKAVQQPPPAKSTVKFKWADPIIGQ